jgi:hypothetical protein
MNLYDFENFNKQQIEEDLLKLLFKYHHGSGTTPDRSLLLREGFNEIFDFIENISKAQSNLRSIRKVLSKYPPIKTKEHETT